MLLMTMPSMRAVSGGRSLLEASTGAADDEAEEDAGRGTGRSAVFHLTRIIATFSLSHVFWLGLLTDSEVVGETESE